MRSDRRNGRGLFFTGCMALALLVAPQVRATGLGAPLRTPLQLALQGEPPADPGGRGEVMKNNDDWHEPWLTADKTHKYLGIGSLLLAGLTVLTAPDDEEGTGNTNDSLHQGLANGALALGVGAVATGLAFHFDDIKLANGLGDPDNLHALLGLIGTTGYAVAVANGGEGGHAAAGIVGALSMAAAIKIEW